MRIRLLLAALTAACCGMAEDPRAAVVFSDWGNRAFANEFDDHLKAAEIGFDKFENIRLPELPYESNGRCLPYRVIVTPQDSEEGKEIDRAVIIIDRFGNAKVEDDDDY